MHTSERSEIVPSSEPSPQPTTSDPRARAIEVERNLEFLSRWLDSQFRVPILGWRFGLDTVLGLVPGVGDTATAAASLYILASAVRYRVPKITLLRMGFNIGIDWAVGAIPFVGDAFDMWWKSNNRNIELIRQRAAVSAEDARAGRASDWLFVGLISLALIALLVGSVTVTYLILRWIVESLPPLF